MKTLKKTLCLVLAVVMVVGVLILPASAADTAPEVPDEEAAIQAKYNEALTALKLINVITGDEGGVRANDYVTRQEAAAIVARMMLTDEVAKGYPDVGIVFPDCDGAWGRNYIAYAQAAKVIAGDEKGFRPNDNVTGYELAKMLLVALGHNPDIDGYNGTDQWAGNVYKDALSINLTAGLDDVNLSKSIKRGEVAQMTYNALTKNRVAGSVYAWDPTTGSWQQFYNTSVDPYSKEKFDMVIEKETTDAWGRPGVYMKTNHYGGAVDFAYYPLVAGPFNVAMDECDIISEYGLTDKASIDKYFRNGVDQYALDTPVVPFTDNGTTINKLHVTSSTGGQGVITEIYELPDGDYAIVQLDTFLAQVTKVTDATTDKNGHTSPRKIDFKVFDNAAKRGPAEDDDDKLLGSGSANSDEFEKGNLILVRKNKGGYEVVGAAPVMVAEGALTDYDEGTHTVGDTKLIDAEKFYLNYRNFNIPTYVAYGDGMGNVIGLAEKVVSETYALVTAIVWNHNGLKGGYVSANLILDDGTVVEDVVISKINGETPIIDTVDDSTDYTASMYEVADNVAANNRYLDHIWRYAKTDKGYELYNVHDTTTPIPDANSNTAVVDSINAAEDDRAEIKNKYPTIADVNGFVARGTNKTIYVIDGKVYEGMDNVPSSTKGDVCALIDGNGYATFVVMFNVVKPDDSNKFVAYVTDPADESDIKKSISGTVYEGHHVYKVGGTSITTVFELPGGSSNWDTTVTVNGTGLYKFEVNGDGVIQNVASLVKDFNGPMTTGSPANPNATPEPKVNLGSNVYIYNVLAYEGLPVNFGTLRTTLYTGTLGSQLSETGPDNMENFYIGGDTKYILVTKEFEKGSTVAADDTETISGCKSDVIVKNDVLIVVANSKTMEASTVYVVKTKEVEPTSPTPTPTDKITSVGLNKSKTGVDIVLKNNITSVVDGPTENETEIDANDIIDAAINCLKGEGYEFVTRPSAAAVAKKDDSGSYPFTFSLTMRKGGLAEYGEQTFTVKVTKASA